MGNQSAHIYSFSFMYSIPTGFSVASNYRAHRKKKVTNSDIQGAKTASGAPSDAVLISVSYLGYMPPSEFEEE